MVWPQSQMEKIGGRREEGKAIVINDDAVRAPAWVWVGSVDAKDGYDMLEKTKKIMEGMAYWGSCKIKPPGVIYQSQRPFITLRLPQVCDSEAVEATSYALMVYIRFGGLIQDQIVRFLNFMRLNPEGFISTYDTIVALEALTEFSFRTHVRMITNMNLTVEPSSQPDRLYHVQVNSDTLAQETVIPILPKVWGHVTVTSKGAGYAVLQLHNRYKVDKSEQLLPGPIGAFEFNVYVAATGRNKSVLSYRACGKWLLEEVSPTSGIAVMEIDIPTGYLQYRPVIDDLVTHKLYPRLMRARVLPKTATFMFEYMISEWTCVQFKIERWFPVANITRWTKARLYDINRPELGQEEIVDNYALYALSICEVCGSYQCPYCPFFSRSPVISIPFGLLLAALFIRSLFQFIYF